MEHPNNSDPVGYTGIPPNGPPEGFQNYPPQNYPPQNYPPQNYPPQSYPPQNYPPPNYVPQNYPPPNYPPPNYIPGPNVAPYGQYDNQGYAQLPMHPVPDGHHKDKKHHHHDHHNHVPLLILRTGEPTQITCPNCHENVKTHVDRQAGTTAWVVCIILCCFCFPFCFYPFLCTACLDTYHRCPHCKATVAIKAP